MRIAIHARNEAMTAALEAVRARGDQPVELELPTGRDRWAVTAGESMLAAERALREGGFDALLVAGSGADALGAALAASRAGLPVIHLDAGRRPPDGDGPTAELTDRLAERAVCADEAQRLTVLELGLEPERVHPDLPAALAGHDHDRD